MYGFYHAVMTDVKRICGVNIQKMLLLCDEQIMGGEFAVRGDVGSQHL